MVQTVSKSRSPTGLRVGFACGQTHLMNALTRVKNSFNSYPLDGPASADAVTAVEDEAWFKKTCAADTDMCGRPGLRPEDEGLLRRCFRKRILCTRAAPCTTQPSWPQPRASGVLVRHFNQPREAQYLRISVGARAQCGALVNALDIILGS